MSEDAGALTTTINGKDVGLATLLRTLESLGKQVDASLTAAGNRIGQAIGAGASKASPALQGVSISAERASKDALSLAQTFARGQAASGDYAGAIERLNSAMDAQSVVNVKQAAQIQNQIQSYERAAVAAREKAAAEAQSTSTLGQLGSVAGSLGLALALPAALSGAQALAQEGASAELVEKRFNQLAQTSGTTGQALLAALRSASGGEISDLNLELSANRAQLLGVAHDAQQMGVLMAIARDRAQQLGTTSAKAFDDLVTGLGRGSPLILDNLGITVKLGEANDAYAASLGKTAAQLTDAERKQALINAVLKDGQASLNQTGGAAASNAGSIDKFNAVLDNLKLKLGSGIAGAAVPTLNALSAMANIFDGSRASVLAWVDAANQYTGAQAPVAAANRAAAESLLAFLGVQEKAVGTTAKLSASDAAFAGTRNALAAQLVEGKLSVDQYNAAMNTLDQAQQRANNAAGIGVGAYAQYGASVRAAEEFTKSLESAISAEDAQAQINTVNTQVQGVAHDNLAAQARNAAQAVIDGGGNIAATGARLAASSSLVDQLTAAYLRLFAAQQAAGIAGAKRIADQAAASQKAGGDLTGGRGVGIGAPGQTGSGDPGQVLKFIADQKAAAQATRDQQYALANQAGQARILQSELAKLTPGTEAYIRKQTELLKLEQSGAKGTGGGRAGAAAKEQKALLKGQEDYQNKALDSARAFEEEEGKIAEDAAKARLAAENKYNLDRRRSKADFYKSLAGMENQDLAKDMSAKYEQAAAKAQEIAKTKGADAAEAYLNAQRQAIADQGDLQAEIAKAEKDKDKGKVAYYQGLLKLQQEADAEELRQIEEQGSQIAATENAQYAEAELRYAEHLNQMGLTYQRKFGNTPAGLAPPPPGAAPASATASAPAGTAPTATGAASAGAGAAQLVSDPDAAAGLGRIEGKLDGLTTAIGAVEKRAGDVERAVRDLKARGVVGGG